MKIFKQFESIRKASAKNIPDHPNTKAVFSDAAIIRQCTAGNVEVILQGLIHSQTELHRLLAPNTAHHLPPLAAPSHYLIHKAHGANNMTAQTHPSRLEDLSI